MMFGMLKQMYICRNAVEVGINCTMYMYMSISKQCSMVHVVINRMDATRVVGFFYYGHFANRLK